MAESPAELGQRVVRLCRELGFASAGIARAAPSERRRELLDWLAAGRHGTMAYLERNVGPRLDVGELLPGARSVIMVADQYAARGEPGVPVPDGGVMPAGRIARYAQGRDYHRVMKTRLHRLADALAEGHPGDAFRSFVDTAPVLEREQAARAGLGWIGRHTLLIDPKRGSYLLLGGIATTLEVAPPPEQRPVADHCGTCTRCIDACPTGAILPYSVDASRCISYLTIEHRGVIDPALHGAMGDWVFGCDVCQEVCPHNSARPAGAGAAGDDGVNPAYRPVTRSLGLLGVLGWDEADRRAAFWSSALKRARLDMMKRNAVIAAGNALARGGAPALRSRIAELAGDPRESELVRRTAGEVLAGLGRGGGAGV